MNDEQLNEQTGSCPENVDEATSREELLHDLAQCLKKTRESKKLTTDEIALSLKLRGVYIDALESGDWSDMPGEVYALGFLKQYANFLGVDVSNSIEKLKTGHYKLTKPLTFPDPSIAPNKTWVIIAALSFIVLIILFNLFDDERPETPPAQQIETPDPYQTTEAKKPDLMESVAEKASAPAPAIETEPTVVKQPPEQMPEPLPEHEYKLTAIDADVWLQLTLPESQEEEATLLREALLRAGESITIRHTSPYLILTCGNPVALQVEINGELTVATGSLGESGKVLHDFKLHSNR